MSARDSECASFIFLSGVGKTYSCQIRAHVLKRHLKRRKENSLVPRPQNKDRASSSSRTESGSCGLAKVALEESNHETSQAKVGGASDTLLQTDSCRASRERNAPRSQECAAFA
jgi:hypothetical protein